MAILGVVHALSGSFFFFFFGIVMRGPKTGGKPGKTAGIPPKTWEGKESDVASKKQNLTQFVVVFYRQNRAFRATFRGRISQPIGGKIQMAFRQ